MSNEIGFNLSMDTGGSHVIKGLWFVCINIPMEWSLDNYQIGLTIRHVQGVIFQNPSLRRLALYWTQKGRQGFQIYPLWQQ